MLKLSNLSTLLQSIVIILAPLYILRFKVIVPTTLLEILLLTSVAVTFFEFLRGGAKWNQLKTKFDIFILFFLLSAILATMVSVDFTGGLGILKAYFVEPVLFFYALVYSSRKYGISYILNSLIISGIWLSLLSALQKLTGSFSLAPYELIQGRVPALYNSANSLALYLCPIALVTLGIFTQDKNIKKKILYFGLFLFFILVIFWTRSRGGMVALVGGMIIFIYTLLALRNRFLKKIWYVIPGLSLLAVLTFLYFFYQNYNILPIKEGRPFISLEDGKASYEYTQGDTLQIRYFIWLGTINMIRDNPIFGAGLDGFKTLYSQKYRLPQFQEEFQYPHNLVLTFWTELGIFGLFVFLLIVTEAISLVLRSIIKNKKPLLGASFLAVLSYMLLHGVVDVPYFKNDLSVQFWTMLALIQVWQEGKN